MRRVGLLGGTFDPPHLGHLVAAETVRDVLALDAVRLLVAGRPWMKGGESDPAHRVAMALEAVAGHDALEVDDRETRRGGPTYTADTLAELHAEEPEVSWTFVLGTDTAAELPEWYRVDEALPLADWVVVGRSGDGWLDHALADRLTRVEMPAIGISSTAIRERVAEERSIRYLVPDPVRAYIATHGLYRPADG